MQSLNNGSNPTVNYYTILRLPQPRHAAYSVIPKGQLKTAYHQALLINHPDKASKLKLEASTETCVRCDNAKYTIDEIMRAYQTLSEPALKAQYDNQLLANKVNNIDVAAKSTFAKGTHIGVEIVDLDDLTFNNVGGQWIQACRCGDEQGYTVTEVDLDRESEEGEIYVGCRGCSLFIKVLFSVVQEDSSDT